MTDEVDFAGKLRGPFAAFCEIGVIGEDSQLGTLPCVATTKAGEVAAGGVVATLGLRDPLSNKEGVGVAGDEGEAVGDALLGIGPRREMRATDPPQTTAPLQLPPIGGVFVKN